MGTGHVVGTGAGHRGITCVLQTKFSSLFPVFIRSRCVSCVLHLMFILPRSIFCWCQVLFMCLWELRLCWLLVFIEHHK